MTKGSQSLVLLLLAGLVAAGLTLWRMGLIRLPHVDAPLVVASEKPLDITPPAAPDATKYPLEPSASRPLSAGAVAQAIIDLLGRETVAKFLQLEEFPRRFAATLDNLGRSHAPHLLWPVMPADGRLLVEEREGVVHISADNASRYTAFVLMAEKVNAARAADLYIRMYPLLQRAYEEQGFPHRYFNDRVIAVIDLLLATPEPEYPVRLQLTEVKGPIPSLHPWTRYEYADPALESLTAGQKMLVRMGAVNQRRLKAKLAEVRKELIQRAPRR